MYCKNCGSKVTDGTLYCTNCGFPVSENSSNFDNSPKQNQVNTFNNSTPDKGKSSFRIFAVIIFICFIIALAVYLFAATDTFSPLPSLKGNSYNGFYTYDNNDTIISFTIAFEEHKFRDFSGTITDDEYGDATFYGRFTGENKFYFNKVYDSSDNFYTYKYEGSIDYKNNLITGSWSKNDGTTFGDFEIIMD